MTATTYRPARYNARRRSDLVPAVGTVRRIRALLAIGHTTVDIGLASGLSEPQVSATLRREMVSPRIADAVRVGYETLRGVPGMSERNVALGALRGWATPDAWIVTCVDDPLARPILVDELAVRLVLDGDDQMLTRLARVDRYAVVAGAYRMGRCQNEAIGLSGLGHDAVAAVYQRLAVGGPVLSHFLVSYLGY